MEIKKLIKIDVSGNKLYKLKYNLLEANSKGFDTLLTFGGAYSNHNSASFMGGIGLDLGKITPRANNFRFDMAVSNYGLLGFVKQFTIAMSL